MSNEDYRKGYRDGWKDAMESKQPNMIPTPYVPGTPWKDHPPAFQKNCPICKRDLNTLSHYVCNHSACPSSITCRTYTSNGTYQVPNR